MVSRVLVDSRVGFAFLIVTLMSKN